MAKLEWDKTGTHYFENGVDHGVLYPQTDGEASGGVVYGDGVAWNGLTSVTQSPEGAEPSAVYADNIKYLSLLSVEEFNATIEAYTYPDEFAACDGSASLGEGVTIDQQARKTFCLSYRTKIGNDVNNDLGYKIHIIYGCLAAPSERAYETVNDSPEAMTLSWEISTTPVVVTGFKPTSHLVIDSTKVKPAALKAIEDALYGKETEKAKVLMPDEVAALIKNNAGA